MGKLSHLDTRGKLRMVDVSGKVPSLRRAKARAVLRMAPETMALIASGTAPKGDVLAVSRIAGIQAAKRVGELIPLCHSLALDHVGIEFSMDTTNGCMEIASDCRLTGRTGVEMEALTAVSVAALTVYDMLKSVQKDMVVAEVRLVYKSGGKSGLWHSPCHDREHDDA